MRPETWLEDLFGNQGRIRVLRALLADPGRMRTEREVAREIKASPNTVNLAVKALRDAGLIEFRRLGRSNAIRLRPDLVLVKHLKAVFDQERMAWQDVRAAIKASVPPDVACVLFGSTARGQASKGSDVDILVVAATQDGAEEAATQLRQAAASVFPLDLGIAALGARELRKKRREPWLRNALAEGEPLSKTLVEAFA